MELALRPHSFLADAQDARDLSLFLAQQSARYQEIRQPLLLLTGTADRIVVDWNHSERLARQAPNAEQVTFDARGHALHHSHSKDIAMRTATFAARHQEAASRLAGDVEVSRVGGKFQAP
ncbi:alpha/beta fold hydrolase [Marinobacterium rhizophilum]|uniref:Serine aminopeptidase S33 domain-containing protein n=1 Tax=Marinobacterium rhizophilum TaxID=420402 RepID=A0ABY5HKW9_9GAMM|nr:hypothetical protein [Marinobacterium rhizophilum]UTW13036.1 hypothetical protein KDW95_05080 [Marinobacterium rhizophilum]